MFTARTGAQDLTAAEDKSIGRPQAGIDGLLFGVGEGADKDWSSHTRHHTTFPMTLLETALGRTVRNPCSAPAAKTAPKYGKGRSTPNNAKLSYRGNNTATFGWLLVVVLIDH